MTRIILDTETTGLNPLHDEILQLAIIDADTGEILLNRRYGTTQVREWPAAEAVNHISPADVEGLPPLSDPDEQTRAAEIIAGADWVGGWNINFDLSMLWGYQIAPRDDAKIIDVMQLDAELCGLVVPSKDGNGFESKWRKLKDAATFWGYISFSGDYHDALTDCRATMSVLVKIQTWQHSDWIKNTRENYFIARGNIQEIMDACSRLQVEMMRRMLIPDDTEESDTVLGQLSYDMPLMAGFLNIMADYSENTNMTQTEIRSRQMNVIYAIGKRMGL